MDARKKTYQRSQRPKNLGHTGVMLGLSAPFKVLLNAFFPSARAATLTPALTAEIGPKGEKETQIKLIL